uniref:Uncharacterized protein n=1 Tax=Panagrolaimus sp. PS1159 TaxID=55785 RepID=A0AC35GL25_9BILA
MNNVLKSPNENTAPMEKDKDEADKGKKGRDKPGDPRIASERYALMNETVRKKKEAQKIIENAVEVPQINDPNLMNISDDEESNNGNEVHQQMPQQRMPSTIPAGGETSIGRNELRKRSNHNPRESRRSNFPLLDMDASLYEICLQPLQFPTPPVLVSNQSNVQNQPSSFQSPFGIPPPPPPPLLPAQQCSPPAAISNPPTEPLTLINQHLNLQHSTGLHSPSKLGSSARTSTDIVNNSPSTNSISFMSPTEPGTTVLSNPSYFSSLTVHGLTDLETVRHIMKEKVFEKFYQDFKNTSFNDINLHKNVVTGLKHIIGYRNVLNDELKRLEKIIAEMANQIEKNANIINGLKGLKESAEEKAKRAVEKKDDLQTNLNTTKERLEKLRSENNKLKEDNAKLKKSHEEEIQKLKDQLKAEQDSNADLKKQKEEVEKDAERSSEQARKYLAQKKEADRKISGIKKELQEAEKENKKMESQLSNLEGDQKILTRSNKELTEKVAEAEKEIKELKDKLKDSEKEKKTAKKEGKSEAEAEMKPVIEKYNQQQKALKLLFRDANTAQILSKKRKIRQEQPAPVSHTVSDIGLSAAKKPRVERERPNSNPLNAIINAIPIPPQPPRTTSASTIQNNITADGTLFANNGLGTLMQQMGANQPPMLVTGITVTPEIVQPNSMGNVVAGIPVIPQGNLPPRMMWRPPQHYLTPPPPYQQHLMQRNESEVVAQATRIRQRHIHVTLDNAQDRFNQLNSNDQATLRQYALLLVEKQLQTNDPHPLIQLVINQYLDSRRRQQEQQQIQSQIQPPRRQTGRRNKDPSALCEPRNVNIASAQATQNQMNTNQLPSSHIFQHQQRSGVHSLQSTRPQQMPFQHPPQQQTPPVQQRVPTPVAPASNSLPHLTRALNARPSYPTVRNASDVDVEALIEMCNPIRRELNGYVRRRFNIPLADNAYNVTDPNLLDEIFRASYSYVTRRN